MSTREELEQRIHALEGRLEQLEDLEAIRNLKARYGRLADSRYADGRPLPAERLEALGSEIAALFTEDAVWDGGKGLGLCRGRDEIRKRLASPTLHFAWHYFVKPELQVDGSTARGRWDILAPGTTPDDRPFWLAGWEEDEYRKVDGVWLHSRMKLHVVFMAPHDRGWARRRETDGSS